MLDISVAPTPPPRFTRTLDSSGKPGFLDGEDSATIPTATLSNTGTKRGVVPKRRFQKGRFEILNNVAYTLYYEDVSQPDGSITSRRSRHTIGRIGDGGMSQRSALREHNQFMERVNLKRGSIAPAVVGQTFEDIANQWRKDVAPNLAASTLRQRESHLRTHILPRFGKDAPHTLTVSALQQFATVLRQKLSRKTVVEVLVTISGIQKYATKQGVRAVVVSLKDLEIGRETSGARRPFFTKDQTIRIIQASKEPYATLFTLAWGTGLRAGELLALTADDLNFVGKSITVNKSADDNTRKIGLTKTETSTALLPMSSVLATVLQSYLANHWRDNPRRLLFPNRKGTQPLWRDNVVKYGLKPVLKKLGIPVGFAGLHAFRHGLATELADRSTPIPVMQKQMRHADIRTTLRVYAHVIPQSQRDAMEDVSIGTVPLAEHEVTATV
jgi:integrase